MLDTPILLPSHYQWNEYRMLCRIKAVLQLILHLIIDDAMLQKEGQNSQKTGSSHQGFTQSNGDVWLACIQIVGRPTSNMQCTKRKDYAQQISGSESEASPVYGILDKAE